MSKSPKRANLKNISTLAIGLFSAGTLLVIAASIFFLFTFINTNNLDNLSVQSKNTSSILMSPDMKNGTKIESITTRSKVIYPGAELPFRQWADPRGTIDLAQSSTLEGFTPISSSGLPFFSGDSSQAVRMIIPALEIDVPVKNLAILNLGDSLEYETPDNTVGHIPGTANPGSIGNGWYFGHLESPFRGEGNVFARLPKIPELIAKGEEVLVVIETDTDKYLYTIVETEVLPAEEFKIFESADSRITLVTCQPRGTYDHRLLVTGRLIGFRKLTEPI